MPFKRFSEAALLPLGTGKALLVLMCIDDADEKRVSKWKRRRMARESEGKICSSICQVRRGNEACLCCRPAGLFMLHLSVAYQLQQISKTNELLKPQSSVVMPNHPGLTLQAGDIRLLPTAYIYI